MTRFKADKGIDFIRRANSNVMPTFGEKMVLASQNKMPNPDIMDFDAEGKLEGWNLLAPDRPDHWNVYVKQLTRINPDSTTTVLSGNYMRQNTSKLGMDEKVFQLADPLISGAPITNAAKEARIAPPSGLPDAQAVTDANAVGWAGATWWFSYAWIMGTNPQTSNTITNCAPGKSIVLAQGQMPQLTMPSGAPEGATGVALLGGPTETTMSIQKRYDIRQAVPASVVLDRYIKGGTIITPTGTNSTYVGGTLARPNSWWCEADTTLYPMVTRVAYKVLTDQGWSQISFYSPYIVNYGTYPGWQLCWSPPSFPPGAKRWLPIFEGDDLQWYTVPLANFAGAEGIPLDYHMAINQNSSNQDDWTYGGKPQQVELNNADETGIEGPTEPLEVTNVGGVQLTPGNYGIKLTYGVDDEETAPTRETVITLANTGGGVTNQIIQVSRPGEQLLRNNRVADKTRTNTDLFWVTPANAGVSATSSDNEVVVADTSAAATDVVVKRSDPILLDTTKAITLRAHIDVTRRVGGAATVAVEMLNNVGTVLNTYQVTPRAITTGITKLLGSWGPGESVAYPAGTTHVRYVIMSIGSTNAARNLDVKVYHMALFRGAAARKRYPLDFRLNNDNDIKDRRSDDPERKQDSYPNGPYCRALRNPTDGAAGIAGGLVEYWAPVNQPMLFNNFMVGMRVPIKKNQAYKFSVYMEGRQLSAATSPLVTTIRNSKGHVLVNNGPVATLAGTSAWTRYNITVPANADASYLQFEGGYVGGGLLRAMGFQLEEGTVVTAFNNTNALSGYFDVAFDTKLSTGAIAPIMEGVTAWLRADAVDTHEYDASDLPLTSASNEFRTGNTIAELDATSWSPSLAAAELVRGRTRYLEVRTNMSSTSATLSPAVRSVFFDVKRHRPMLYRSDGSEFPGGVLVLNFPAPQMRRNIVPREYADGSRGFDDVGRGDSPILATGWSMQAFDDDAVSEIAYLQGYGDGTFIVEFHDRRYTVRFFNASFEAARSQWTRIAGKIYWVHNASGIEAEVLGEEIF